MVLWKSSVSSREVHLMHTVLNKAGEEQGTAKVNKCTKAFGTFQARDLLLSHARQNRPHVQECSLGVRPEQSCSAPSLFRRPIPPRALPGNGSMSPELSRSNKWKVVRAFPLNRCCQGFIVMLVMASKCLL